ncbi:dynein axonemal heavy chain 6-like [Penaeus indicus]|uniref:dynein axonemal heavy chain 6-like n=1 Tax=Penaeus indicus TaxID=29960 RepID=UPI00300D375B
MSSAAAPPQSRPSSVPSRPRQQRWDSSDDHHKTGVTVTLPTIQVTEAKQPQATTGTGGLEVLPTELIDTSGLPKPLEEDTHAPNASLLSPPGEIPTSFLPALSGPSKSHAPGADLKLPPLVEAPVVPPRTLDDAIELVSKCNMMLYLTLKHPPSELEYNPYSFNFKEVEDVSTIFKEGKWRDSSESVVSGRPKGLREYAILSNAGVTQVWPTEVTFTPIDAFQREFQLYNKLRKIRFFRVFRLRKTWQVWRKIVRSRKLREAKARITAYLVILQPPFFGTLANVAALCHKLSHMGLLEVALEDPVVTDAWVSDVQGALESVRTRLHAFRSLLLQVVASMVHTDEPAGDGDVTTLKEDFLIMVSFLFLIYYNERIQQSRTLSGSELLSGEKKSPRSNTGSSSMPRRHSSASIVKMVRVVDLMVASALRTILHNTVKSLLDTIVTRSTVKEKEQADEEAEEEIGAMFLVKVSVEENVIVCTPTQEALMGGLRTVVRMCEMTVLSIQPLLPYFTPHDRLSAVASDENTVLRTMLEDDSLLKESIGKVLSLVEDKWQKVEAEVNPLDDLLKEAQTPPREEGIQDQDMNELGSWLGRVEGLVETVRSIREVVNLGLLQVDQTAARRVLVTSLRQQQQRMHQDVSQGFDQRVKKLQAEATDKWLGLEMAPVTAQQVVTLLNYVTEVKKEMERVNGEESVIQQAYAMIQGYHITLHPEVHNKYEALQKELKRLRKCVRRSLMERPTMIRKLNQLLQKEIEELDAETVKLSEQVQVQKI